MSSIAICTSTRALSRTGAISCKPARRASRARAATSRWSASPLAGTPPMKTECRAARQYLAEIGIEAEVIDPIWLSPLDTDTIAESVDKTGRLLVVDNGWTTCGAGAEIVAQVGERLMGVRD